MSTWLSRDNYIQVKKQEQSWEKAKKSFPKNYVPWKGWVPYAEYKLRKQLTYLKQGNLIFVYIPGDYMGKVEDSPAFYKPLGFGGHLFERYLQNGKRSLVKHLPRDNSKVTVNEQWWRDKFGTPL